MDNNGLVTDEENDRSDAGEDWDISTRTIWLGPWC